MTCQDDSSPEDARVAKTKRRILDAGARILFTQGWGTVTHLCLAQDTGIARGTIYRHWPTIDDLIVDIFEICDPTPYIASKGANLRTDLIAQMKMHADHLTNSALGDIILNAALQRHRSEKMALIHRKTHEILLEGFLVVLGRYNYVYEDKTFISALLLGPLLYHHLFAVPDSSPSFEPIVDNFLERLSDLNAI